MYFGPLDLVIVHLLGLFIGLYVAPRLMPGWGHETLNNSLDKDIDQAIVIANDLRKDPKNK